MMAMKANHTAKCLCENLKRKKIYTTASYYSILNIKLNARSTQQPELAGKEEKLFLSKKCKVYRN